MKDEYIIINKTAIQQKIEELEWSLGNIPESYIPKHEAQIYALKEILSQSTPLIPEIEKAVLEGVNSIHFENDGSYWREDDVVETYIANLKLDI
jgi:hypothetical protein